MIIRSKFRVYAIIFTGLQQQTKNEKKKPQKSKLQMHVKQNRDYGFYAAVRKPNDGGGGESCIEFSSVFEKPKL